MTSVICNLQWRPWDQVQNHLLSIHFSNKEVWWESNVCHENLSVFPTLALVKWKRAWEKRCLVAYLLEKNGKTSFPCWGLVRGGKASQATSTLPCLLLRGWELVKLFYSVIFNGNGNLWAGKELSLKLNELWYFCIKSSEMSPFFLPPPLLLQKGNYNPCFLKNFITLCTEENYGGSCSSDSTDNLGWQVKTYD